MAGYDQWAWWKVGEKFCPLVVGIEDGLDFRY